MVCGRKSDDIARRGFRGCSSLYHRTTGHRLVDVMIKNPAVVTSALELMLMTRHLERIGDHATNIAEDVFFVVAGEDIRHQTAGLTRQNDDIVD